FYAPPPLLHSFPTRRSSDLTRLVKATLNTLSFPAPQNCVQKNGANRRWPSSENWPEGGASVCVVCGVVCGAVSGVVTTASYRSSDRKEHTSELQSPDHLVCR